MWRLLSAWCGVGLPSTMRVEETRDGVFSFSLCGLAMKISRVAIVVLEPESTTSLAPVTFFFVKEDIENVLFVMEVSY